MPLPFLLAGAAVAAGMNGVKKGARAMTNNSEAKTLMNTAEQIYNESSNKLEEQRSITTHDLESLGQVKLEVWGKEMDHFVKVFKAFKNINMEDDVHLNERLKMRIQAPDNLKNMEIATLKAEEVLSTGVSSLGAGALAGIASYGGAMMFASASTGTAIASLSGAAATNATLAWFGGGSLAAGGFGMAGGTLVLGGIVAGPVLAVAGSIMAAKSEENLSRAKSKVEEARNAAVKMGTMTDFMSSISKLAKDYESFILMFAKMFAPIIERIENIRNQGFERIHAQSGYTRSIFDIMSNDQIDFEELSEAEQKSIHLSWLMAQILYSVLSAPLLTSDGDLDEDAVNVLDDAKSSILELEETEEEVEQMNYYEHGKRSAYDYSDYAQYEVDSDSTKWEYEEESDSSCFNGERYADAPFESKSDKSDCGYEAKTIFSGEYKTGVNNSTNNGSIQESLKGVFGTGDRWKESGKKLFGNAADQMKQYVNYDDSGSVDVEQTMKKLKSKGSSFLSKKLSNLADKLNNEEQ